MNFFNIIERFKDLIGVQFVLTKSGINYLTQKVGDMDLDLH